MNTITKIVLITILIIIIVICITSLLYKNNQNNQNKIKITKEYFNEKNAEIVSDATNFESHEIPFDPNYQLGNYLSCYFYNMGLAFLHGKDFKTTTDKNRNIFTYYFPKYVKLDSGVHSQFASVGITDDLLNKELNDIDGHCVSAWNVLTKEREQFWEIMKPTVHKIIDEALEKAGLKKTVDSPVLHFRCSDVPFQRLEYYHFQKYTYIKNALEQIAKKNNQKYENIYICYCNTHTANPDEHENKQTACDRYSKEIVKYLQESGYNPILKCDTINEDFATMFYAPALIATSGSFSFFAGYFSNSVFISTMYDEKKSRECTDCGEWLQNGYTLKHSEVLDYYDTDTVIKLLREPYHN
jgi:hypothetical protein